jgi:hypothetical protein
VPPIAVILTAAALLSTPAPAKLSDEWGTTEWAHPASSAAIYDRPGGRSIARLHARTEMKDPEVYLMLSQQTDARGQLWVHIRVPGQPNGRTGWVRRSSLSTSHITHTALLIDKRRLRATLLEFGRPVWSAPIGIGTPTTPTPPGRFYVRELIKMVPGNGGYGPYIFGTSGYAKLSDFPGGGIIGVHGTSEPGLIPGAPSHGCVRLRNQDIATLARRLAIGASVRIRN